MPTFENREELLEVLRHKYDPAISNVLIQGFNIRMENHGPEAAYLFLCETFIDHLDALNQHCIGLTTIMTGHNPSCNDEHEGE